MAGKLHTARSRNDQVATDMHLYLKAKLVEVIEKIDNLRNTLVSLADKHTYTIMPGTPTYSMLSRFLLVTT